MTLTPKILEARRGVNLGFFYLRLLGEGGSGTKVNVFVKNEKVTIWDGVKWRSYADYEPDTQISDAVESCETFNGKL